MARFPPILLTFACVCGDKICGPNCQHVSNPLSNWDRDRNCAAGSCFMVRRMHKVGGTFLSAVLTRVVARTHLAIVKDAWPMPCQSKKNFVVGVMRNPCSFYSSLAQYAGAEVCAEPVDNPWCVGPKPNTSTMRKFMLEGPTIPEYTSWLAASRRPGGMGFFSYHFWTHYVRNDCMDNVVTSKSKSLCAPSNCSVVALTRDMQDTDLVSLADCWIFTETLLGDLARCLKLYMKTNDMDNSSDIVNWKAVAQFDQVPNSKAAKIVGLEQRKHPDRLSSRGTSCNAFSPVADGLIWHADPFLFKSFNYTRCCQARTAVDSYSETPKGHI